MPAFDDAQKQAIAIEKNAVVSAGAGSGKTSVLSSRFAHLVLDKNYKVEEILTLTFTKKATVEMYGRIYATLSAADPGSVAEFHKANIKTLDGYCATIAKEGAHFYGISPDFREDEDAVRTLISGMALPFLLENRHNPAVRALVRTGTFADTAEKLLVEPLISHSPIAEPRDFLEDLRAQRAHVQAEWASQAKAAADKVNDLCGLAEEFSGNRSTDFFKKLSAALAEPMPETPRIDAADFATGNADAPVAFVQHLERIASISPRGKNIDDLKEVLYALRPVVTQLSALAHAVAGSPVAEAAMHLLQGFQRRVNDAKRASGLLTYADVASLATCILRDHPEIRQREKRAFKAIMIDEFQDNNAMQRDLLFLLAERQERRERSIPGAAELCPGKLFFVGDEKQSIYRFRGADVSVFRSLSQDFRDGHLTLSTNYRSHPALIAAFNTLFGGTAYPPRADGGKRDGAPAVFLTGTEADIPTYEASYTDAGCSAQDKAACAALAQDTDAYRAFYAPRVHVALYDTTAEPQPDQVGDEEAEALWVAETIRDLIQTQGVRPEDIAILFRTYALQPLYERTLLAQGIPYDTETITGFFNSAPVTDTFAFLRICAYPHDAVAYEHVLHSPFVSLDNNEAYALLAQSTEPFAASADGILSGSSRERYDHARRWYATIRESARLEPLTTTLSRLWYEAGYRYETLWNERVNMYATLYDRMFELARAADAQTQNLAEFVDSVRTYEDESKHLDGMDIPLEQRGGVHLLTIFKSKGLQYRVVFICGAHKKGRPARNDSPVYLSKEFGLTINTPPHPALNPKERGYFFKKAKSLEAKLAGAELRRLTYVALTRARDCVYITAKSGMDFSKADKYLPGSGTEPQAILNVLEPCIAFYSAPEHAADSPITFLTIPPYNRSVPGKTRTKAQAIQAALPHYAQAAVLQKDAVAPGHVSPSDLPAEPEDAQGIPQAGAAPYPEIAALVESTIPPHRPDQAEPEPRFTYADFGSVAHAYLEAALSHTVPRIPNRAVQGLEGNKKKLSALHEICMRMQGEFLATDVGKAAEAAPWRRMEYAFRSRVGGILLSGQIDLVFRNAQGGYTIVDYKTNQAIEPELYYAQLACYRHAVSQMFQCPAEQVQCYLYYLRHAKAVDVGAGCAAIDLPHALTAFTHGT